MTALAPSAEFTLPQRFRSNRRSPGRWLVTHTVRYWPLWILLFIGAFSNAALAAAVPVLTGDAFNAILAQPPVTATLLRIALLIVATQLVRSVLQFGRNFAAELIGQRVERDIRDELYGSLLGKSMTFHSLQPLGDTMARATNDVREINLMFSPGINLVVGSANFLFMPLLVAPRYHPALMLTPAVYIILYGLALWHYLYELQPITRQVRQSFGHMNTRLTEALDGIETVKGAAQEAAEIDRFRSAARRFRDAFVWQGDVEARFLPLLLLGLAIAAGFLHAVLLFLDGLLSVGDVVAYVGLLQLLGFPTFVSLFAYSQVSSGMSAAARILELINRETNLDENASGLAQPMRGAIEFRHASFSYDEDRRAFDAAAADGQQAPTAGALRVGALDRLDRMDAMEAPTSEPRPPTSDLRPLTSDLRPPQGPALSDISFRVRPGQTVAIVGQTGAGKTTLARLVNRTYDVSAGQVLVDGVDVRDWSLEALRQQISIIEQDIFLFSRSIADNIRFGKPNATQAEIEAAAKAAQAHEFIMGFKDGYDAIVGERGVTLSGGQRQRLALARAFLTDPRILILDDSTSAIDSATEDRIQRAIYAAARGRTTLIITHRLSQIRWADLVVVLRGGHVAAIGSHEDLLETSAAYRRIFAE